MIRALIFGATGYTGLELVRLLSAHPEVTIVGGSSRQWAGKRAGEVFPFIRGDNDFSLFSTEQLDIDYDTDVAFLCLPHGESAARIRPLLDRKIKVVDLSADCRIKDLKTYEEWYVPHKDPDLLPKAVYGLPEIHRSKIRQADLVANPGCYPTSTILALAPLLDLDEVDCSRPVVDSKSGISGAGRGAKLVTSFCESGEGFKPYGVLGHRHIPEMEQELTLLNGEQVMVRFTPHLIPASRGMVTDVYVRFTGEVSEDAIRSKYMDRYAVEPFVTVLPKGTFPNTAHVRGSNMCQVAVEVDTRTGWIVAMSAIDNLVKGASGAAVQNMNLIMGIEETTGLEGLPLFP
ncbi:N-acetyl-gamma-glutamyl-phosphate reductase [Thermodesulfobacteriota bacterium]